MVNSLNPDRSVISGRNLKKLVKQKLKMTQERFAELAEVDVRTVGRWYNEGIDKLSTIKRLADLLEISDELLINE